MTESIRTELRFISGLHSDPAWLQGLGLPPLLTDFCVQNRHPRTVGRLYNRLADQIPLPAMAAKAALPSRLLDLKRSLIEEWIVKAGAIWHSGRLKWIIERSDRARVVEALGLDVFGLALRNIDLRAGDGDRIDLGILVDTIRQDGHHCWQSWLGEQPPALRARLGLIAPPTSLLNNRWNDQHQRRGAKIIRRIMREVETAS